MIRPPRLIVPAILTILSLSLLIPQSSLANNQQPITQEQCEHMARTNFCKISKEVMRQKCPGWCDFVKTYGRKYKRFPHYVVKNDVGDRFFDLEANDYRGRPVDFEDKEGYITLVVNVESRCDAIDELMPILSSLRKSFSFFLEIMVFPEPMLKKSNPPITSCQGIKKHSATLGDGKIIIMEESDINDSDHPVYGYLRSKDYKLAESSRFLGPESEPLGGGGKSVYFLVDMGGDLEVHEEMDYDKLMTVVGAHADRQKREL